LFKALKEKAQDLSQNISVLCIAYKRKDVPFRAKVFIVSAVVYGLSPIDLIPDFIPVLVIWLVIGFIVVKHILFQ
jgi:uncharacterized membrane protein YkvA (DUF1232 family)